MFVLVHQEFFHFEVLGRQSVMAPVVRAVDDEIVVPARPVYLRHVHVDVVPSVGAVFAEIFIFKNTFSFNRSCVIFSPISATEWLRLRVYLNVLLPGHRLVENLFAHRALDAAFAVVNVVVMQVLKQQQ